VFPNEEDACRIRSIEISFQFPVSRPHAEVTSTKGTRRGLFPTTFESSHDAEPRRVEAAWGAHSFSPNWRKVKPSAMLGAMKPKTAWWKSQYLDPVMTEIMFDWKTNTKAEVDQILSQMNPPAGAHILDLACGQGAPFN
jgi:hypothetical protein